MITTWAIMIGRDRDFNHVEDIGRQYYVLKLVEFQTFENRNFHYKHKDIFTHLDIFLLKLVLFQKHLFLHQFTSN
jgi:hypothetical protein